MSDTPPERNSNSKSNLIEVQHVGVTAKIQSPLKNLLQSSSSSTETENGQLLFHTVNKTRYNKFSNDTQEDSEITTDTSKILYEMRTIRNQTTVQNTKSKLTPSKIEFQLYKKPVKRCGRRKSSSNHKPKKNRNSKRKLFSPNTKKKSNETVAECSILQRLRHSLHSMRMSSMPNTKSKIYSDLPPTNYETMAANAGPTLPSPRDTRIGIYPFEHGCADYLRTTDMQPQILSVVLAERATQYATRFWAEVFGSLHIGVTFVVTFLLQTYRFLLYSLVNTLLVGFLHMTSDYLIKPLLTVLFNGYLQPPLIFIYNVLTSIRDILEPVADTLNNFMKPVATVGKSLRLVNASYNKRKITAKEV